MFIISVGMPGPFELMIILAIVLILFGAGKLPKVLGQMGKGVKAFKEGLSGQGDAGEDAVEGRVLILHVAGMKLLSSRCH